ncbi:MAG: hypothetical protein GTN76_08305 [Candidatus Aenigmarchaeota archaeon]|nr:hypothetical protein [Candidatus Aenigmarchaeota archaeon]
MLGQFYPITSDYDVFLTAGRGWGSTTHVWDSVRMITDRDNKKIRILHFGDIDLSGWGMIGDIEKRLNEFGLGVVLEHVLLDEDDIKRYNLIPSYKVMAKKGTQEYDKLRADPRAERFENHFGELFQVEVEAMEPNELIRMLKEALDRYHDPKLKKSILVQEQLDLSRINIGLRKIKSVAKKKGSV